MSFDTVESVHATRARRHRRTAITLAVVVAILAGAFYYAQSYWNEGPAKTTATATCTPTGLAPSQVTVNVYNATRRSGLAAATARSLTERGFLVGTVANDPLKKTVPQPAEVRFGANGEAASALVVAIVPGSVAVIDTRADASVDLVLGEAYQGLAPAPTTTPTC